MAFLIDFFFSSSGETPEVRAWSSRALSSLLASALLVSAMTDVSRSVPDAAAAGAAVLDATLYGFDEAAGLPAEIGGVLLIQGDSGIISGIFAADLRPAAPAPAQ